MKTKNLFLIPTLIAVLNLLSTGRVAATITVTSTADSGMGTLRAALASAGNGDTIDATGVSGSILLTSGELLITSSVTILGPGPANLAVDGNADVRVFHISGAIVSDREFTGNVTMSVSTSLLSSSSASYGGGVYNDGYNGSATLQLLTSTLSINSASANGGGIYNNGESSGNGMLTVSNSIL